MENNSNEVVEIDLKDLMFAVLYKWRPVLAVAVIMAVLLGGAKGAMTYRKQNDPETVKEARVTYRMIWSSMRRISLRMSARWKISAQILRTSRNIWIIRSGST